MRRDLSKWFSSLASARRSPAGRRMERKGRTAGVTLGGSESLERRAMLAVTAELFYGGLYVELLDASDEATLTSDGTKYTVSGTGLAGQQFNIADLDRISVRGPQGLGENTSFTIGKGSDVVSRLFVDNWVGTTTINQRISLSSGDIDINSTEAIFVNVNLSTLDGSIALAGPITLGGTSSDLITMTADGAGGVTLLSTVDGASGLVVNTPDTTSFNGAIGGKTALASLETDEDGTTIIAGGSVRTVGSAGQTFNDAVLLQSDVTLDAAAGPVTFASTVDQSRYFVSARIELDQPTGVALSKDGTRAYVSGIYGDDVTVLDTTTKAILTTVGVGASPAVIKLAPDGATVWTANEGDSSEPNSSVSVIATATNLLLQTIPTGDVHYPTTLSFTPDGKYVYATSLSGSDWAVKVIDTTTRTVVDTIPVADDPMQIVFSPNGDTAYVTCLSGFVSVIRTSDRTVTDTIPVGDAPEQAAILPNGSKLYVVNHEGNSVSVIDTGTKAVVKTIDTGVDSKPLAIVVSADGSRAYVSLTESDKVLVINTATDVSPAEVETGRYPRDLVLSPDGEVLYVANYYSDTITVIDTRTNTAIETFPVGSSLEALALSPDGKKLYVCTECDDELAVITANAQFSLTVNSTGLTTFGGDVGSVWPLVSLTTNAGGTTAVNAGYVRTTGLAGQSYGDAVTLGAPVTFQSDLAGPITFASALDGAAQAEFIAGEGAVTFKGAVGGETPLAGLIISSASSTTGESTLSLDGSAKLATVHGLTLGPGVSNVSFANGGTIKNFTGNGIYAPDEGIQTLVASTFDFGTDGWKVGNFLVPTPTPTDPDWDFSGGNPGGFISTTDLYGVTAFLAPSQFLGNWAADRVTGLTFNLRVSDSAAVNKATVVLSGGGISISKFGPYPTPNDTWVPYTLDLTSRSGWFYTNDGITPGAAVSAADFATVLANVTALRINAEWSTAPGATVDLDNVVLLANFPNDNLTFRGLTVEDNGGAGMYLDKVTNVLFADGVIRGNGGAGVTATDGEDITIQFSEISGNAADGVLFTGSTGLIEGNEIFENGEDGIYVSGVGFGEDDPAFLVNVLGNIVRDNADDGVHFDNGKFVGEDLDVQDNPFSRVAGNTIEGNADNGVELSDARGVFVGGPSVSSDGILGIPSDINVINLNGHAGVYATGRTFAFVAGNEIDSNAQYGVENDGAYGLVVGYPTDELANTIRRNGEAGVFVHGKVDQALVFNNDISENPIGVMLTSVTGTLVVGGPNSFPGEDVTLGNRIFDNGEGLRATGSFTRTQAAVLGNLFENNLTGATLASAQGLYFGVGDGTDFSGGNIVQNNNEGLRASGDLTGTTVTGNQFLDNTKVGIALQSAKNLTVGGEGEDARNFVSGSPVGLSASGTMTGTEVVGNRFSENVVGIALSKATGMTVDNNTMFSSTKYGISVTGNNAGTQILDNTVTGTGDGPYLGSGIYLNGARNVEIIGNDVYGSSLAGLYATGNTSGTVVQGNVFSDNRIGMFLDNARNAVFGGLGEDEGNTIVGGGDPLLGEYRDGILVAGTSTGSSITGTDITDASTGVWFRDAQGIDVNNTYVEGSKFFGFNASGDLSGSKFHDNVVTNTVGIAGGLGHGLHLEGAQNLQVYDNLGEDSFGSGLFVTGNTAGTTVRNNLFDGNRVGISLINATNAAIGGLDPFEQNFVVGGSDAANGVYRDGIQVIGTSTGSSISGTEIGDVTTGVTLENATGLTVNATKIEGAQFLGVNAQGTLTGTSLQNTTIMQTGGLGALGHGIYLANALGLEVVVNTVTDSTGGGLYATGTTTGTTVFDNTFTGNRVGIYLVNATDAVIGGIGAGEDNRIVGGGDASKGDFRDGILATGTLTGSSIVNASVSNTATGITLSAATGLVLGSVTVSGSQVYGLNASGVLTGTKMLGSSFTATSGSAGGGAGVLLAAAQQFTAELTQITDNVVGLLATGDCSGTQVLDTTWTTNATDLINNSTGVPSLVIAPLPS